MSKMTRRTFAQFFGASMVGVSLAVFGTGLVSSKTPAMLLPPGVDPGEDAVREYVGPAVEGKWIGGENDTFDSWATSWRTMSVKSGYITGGENITLEELERVDKNWRLKVVDNVFKQDPLLAYLKRRAE